MARNNKFHQRTRCLKGKSILDVTTKMEGLIGTISKSKGLREVIVSIHSFQIIPTEGLRVCQAVVVYNAIWRGKEERYDLPSM